MRKNKFEERYVIIYSVMQCLLCRTFWEPDAVIQGEFFILRYQNIARNTHHTKKKNLFLRGKATSPKFIPHPRGGETMKFQMGTSVFKCRK